MSIPSQLNSHDHALLKSAAQMLADIKLYNYLEIGSWLGGSLQYQLINDRCVCAMSVDTRSRAKIRDERAIDYAYSATTQDMLDILERNRVPTRKLTCVDGCIDDVQTDIKFDLVFIDGEHTHDAAFHDAVQSLSMCADSALILFHDAWIVHEGIDRFLAYLTDHEIDFGAYKVAGSDIMGVAVGDVIEPWQLLTAANSEDWNTVKLAAISKLPKKETK